MRVRPYCTVYSSNGTAPRCALVTSIVYRLTPTPDDCKFLHSTEDTKTVVYSVAKRIQDGYNAAGSMFLFAVEWYEWRAGVSARLTVQCTRNSEDGWAVGSGCTLGQARHQQRPGRHRILTIRSHAAELTLAAAAAPEAEACVGEGSVEVRKE